MKRFVLAYAMDDAPPMFTVEDVSRLTHINLVFGLIKDGVLDLSGLTHIGLIETFREWNPELRVVLSVGGWGAAAAA